MGPVIESVGGREDKGRDEVASPGHDSTVDTGHSHLRQAGRRHSFFLGQIILQNYEYRFEVQIFNGSHPCKILFFMILNNRPM